MIGVADHAGFSAIVQQLRQRRFAFDERRSREITSVEIQQVEHVINEAIAAFLQISLQQREAADAVVVFHHDFAVQKRGFRRQRSDRLSDRLETMRPVLLLARQQSHLAVIKPRLHPVAVKLDLMQPIRSAGHLVIERGQTERDEIGQFRSDPTWAFRLFATFAGSAARTLLCRRSRPGSRSCRDASDPLLECCFAFRFWTVRAVRMPDAFFAAPTSSDLLDRSACRHRARFFFQDILVPRTAGFVVFALDQQPVVVTIVGAAAHPDEMPAAVQFLAVQIENKMALGVAAVRIAVGCPGSAVPDHHRAAAVFAFGDGAFESVVFDGMILDVNGETFVVGVKARAARDRPALHHAVELKAQIVVQPPGRMFLNDVAVPVARSFSAARLRRNAELSLFAVGFERHGTLTHAFSVFRARRSAAAGAPRRQPRNQKNSPCGICAIAKSATLPNISR